MARDIQLGEIARNASPDVLARNPELAAALGLPVQLTRALTTEGDTARGGAEGDTRPGPFVVRPHPTTARDLLVVEGAATDSKLESDFWNASGDVFPGTGLRVVSRKFKPFTLRVEAGRYTPDALFVIQGEPLPWVVEVKGKWEAYQSGRDSKHRLRQAASRYAEFWRFLVVTRPKGGNWEAVAVEPMGGKFRPLS